MTNQDNLYCKIYVDTDVLRHEILEKVANLLGGTVDMNEVRTQHCEIDVKKNEDFDEERRREFPDGFLYFRYYMDVEGLADRLRSEQIALIANLLEHLWLWGFQAVAACDYEEELPRKGGYNWRVAVAN